MSYSPVGEPGGGGAKRFLVIELVAEKLRGALPEAVAIAVNRRAAAIGASRSARLDSVSLQRPSACWPRGELIRTTTSSASVSTTASKSPRLKLSKRPPMISTFLSDIANAMHRAGVGRAAEWRAIPQPHDGAAFRLSSRTGLEAQSELG